MQALGYQTVEGMDEAIEAAKGALGGEPHLFVLPSIRQPTPTHLFAREQGDAADPSDRAHMSRWSELHLD